MRLLLLLVGAQLLGTAVFLGGFFPSSLSSGEFATREDLPKTVGGTGALDVERLYRRRAEKLVLMVIDALRYDFVGDPGTMPFTVKEISEGRARLAEARVEAPTVTLPRIKAMTTGTHPNYADVMTNFRSQRLQTDNLIHQAVEAGLKVVFYGDDTWLKLFPDQFTRAEGTSSFFVSDWTEVDNNVTRNLDRELVRGDWDVMLLHYLGLDHIGHLEGPSSPLVPPKLREMDSVIAKIRKESVGVLIVCGDHGMKDSGGHGGTSPAEVSVPVLIFDSSKESSEPLPVINQIDMVPFVCFLLGIPIPSDSYAKLEPGLVQGQDPRSIVYALHYTTGRLASHLIRHYGDVPLYRQYSQMTSRITQNWWENFLDHPNNVSSVIGHYSDLQRAMSDLLMRDRCRLDLYSMSLGILLFLLVFLVNVSREKRRRNPFDGMLLGMLIALLIGINDLSCGFLVDESTFCDSFLTVSVSLRLIISFCVLYAFRTLNSGNLKSRLCISLLLLFINFYGLDYNYYTHFRKLFNSLFVFVTVSLISLCLVLLSGSTFTLRKLFPVRNGYLLAGTFMHLGSLASTSYIEEEHQLWYFLSVSLVLLKFPSHFPSLSGVLLVHRVLRKLNQTGDKWASLPDLGDWLNIPENKHLMTGAYLIGLIATLLCSIMNQKPEKKSFTNIFSCIALIAGGCCAFCVKLATGSVIITWLQYPASKGLSEAKTFWYSMGLFLALRCCSLLWNRRDKDWVEIIIGSVSSCASLIFCLLMRPHNVLLLPAIRYFSYSIDNCYTSHDVSELTVIYYWLGKLFYYFQGNSNSLASIDVASGYVGMSDYDMTTTGSFVFLHTFAAEILAYFLLIGSLKRKKIFGPLKERFKVYGTLIFLTSLQLVLYSMLVMFQRHHLFIWSVFSPKLLYLSAHSLLYCSLICFTELIVLWSHRMQSLNIFLISRI